MRAEIESLLGVCRKSSGDRYYYDCPNCTIKDPRGQLVVNWKENKFICNHVSSCGFAGTIDKSLTYTLGIKRKKTHVQEVKVKTQYELKEVKPIETAHLEVYDLDYSAKEDRERQIRHLFAPNSQLVGCIDSQYGNPIKIDSSALICDNQNYTHFKVNAGGSKVEDIKDFRYTLIESDETPDIHMQMGFIKSLKLPVASITWSGNKSLHALVKIEASTLDEYKERVSFLHEVCDSVGFVVDKTKDCCRFTRLAGSVNNKTGEIQKLIHLDYGASSWVEWKNEVVANLIKVQNVKNSSHVKMSHIKRGFSSGFVTHDYNDSGLKDGDVTLLTGKRNQGKTTFSRQMIMASATQKIKSFVWYGEGDVEVEKGNLIRLIAEPDEMIEEDNGYGRTIYRPNEQAEDRYNKEYGEFVDMYVKPLDLKIPVFEDLFRQMRTKASHGCKLYVIDNMMKLTADQDNVNKAQCYIISKLKEFAVNYQVHVVIIAHPKKGDGDQSVSGAMEQENTVDTILRFKRVFTTDGLEKGTKFPASQLRRVTALVLNEKVRNGGTQHKIFMEFDHVRQANIDLAYLPEVESLTNSLYKDHLYSRFTTNVDDFGGRGVNPNVF